MRMLSAASLFHFTPSLTNLRGILERGFEVRVSVERMEILARAFDRRVDVDRTGIPMVCFCDLRLSQAPPHMDRYGSYAIGLTKEWAEAQKIAPVLYGHRNNPLVDAFAAYGELLHRLNIADRNDSQIRRRALEAGRLAYFFKPYEGDDPRAPGQPRRFYDEREWRFVPDNIEDCPTIAPDWASDAELRANVQEYLSKCSQLTFDPSHITHIITQHETEIPQVINAIRRSTFLPRENESLLTKITTADRIRADF